MGRVNGPQVPSPARSSHIPEGQSSMTTQPRTWTEEESPLRALYSSPSLELINWKWVFSMFWKGRRGEKRLLELITVRNHFSRLPEPRNPTRGDKGGKDRVDPSTSKSWPKKGHALSERNLLSAATVSTIYHLNAHCIPRGQKQTRQLHFKAKNQKDPQALSLLSLYAFNSII